MEPNLTRQQILDLIERNKRLIIECESRPISKTGIKWCKQTYRENIKRLRNELKFTAQ